MWLLSQKLALLLATGISAPAPPAPPGFNVHLVREIPTGRFWRGGAPRPDTLQALAASAQARKARVTLIDLRSPAHADDLSGKGGRLSPAREAEEARKLGLRYESVSALDRHLLERVQAALEQGDVYLHCMYGVNRTGFAAARYARATGQQIGTEGLGPRDWRQGDRFQERLEGRHATKEAVPAVSNR
jgi:hypothetical protein